MQSIIDKINKTQLRTPKETYTVDYEWAIEACEKQFSILWSPSEIDVETAIQDLKTNFSKAEYHGVTTALKTFTQLELEAGIGYWGGRVTQSFQRPADIQRLAQLFAMVEGSIHAPFYSRLNDALNIGTDEFYDSYKEDQGLKGRMDLIGSFIGNENLLISLGSFSMVEGAILYSSFGFLKSFQSNGKNKLKSVVSGINFSHKDEDIHAVAGAMLFRTLLKESKLEEEELNFVKDALYRSARSILDHEKYNVKLMFSEGHIENITEEALVQFVQSRLNLCLQNLGLDAIFDAGENPIAKWFYKGINALSLHDFFNAGAGNEYNTNCNRDKFKFNENYNFSEEKIDDN